MSGLTNSSPLSFPLALVDGTIIKTVGEAAAFLASLSRDHREEGHWTIAIQMLNIALKEPTYLKAATMSLRTAFVVEGRLVAPHPLDDR